MPDNVWNDQTIDDVDQKSEPQSDIKLDPVPNSKSNITFNNYLVDTGNLNPFVWNFIYTGGGVGTGDLDNDGLPDIFFCGNQLPDQIYKNMGSFEFKDMSVKAKINSNGWSTGVFFADVNNDGLLDIYVCRSSPSIKVNSNRNKLYINNGDFNFEEQAAKYGIDDPGFSTHATFLDLDQDGDLDLYLVNQPIDIFAKHLYPPDQVNQYPVSDKVYINNNGKFIDQSKLFDISTNRHGLGISIGDFDWNGYIDLFIGSDYHHPDQLLMGQPNGFKNELEKRIGHQSFYSMGSDVADINNDGWLDLMVLDMAFSNHERAKTNMASMDLARFQEILDDGGYYQYAMNALHKNKGNGTFVEVAQQAGVAKTDWSWGNVFVDLNLDGWQDLVVTNGIFRDMQNNDFNDYIKRVHAGQVGPNNYKEVLKQLPSTAIGNNIFQNKGDGIFEDISESSGFNDPGFSHGLAYADFNLDGKVDLVINNMNKKAEVYENKSTGYGNYISVKLKGPQQNTFGLGAQVVIYSEDLIQTSTMQTTRGYYSSSEPILHFGLGENRIIDSLKVFWNKNEMSFLLDIKSNQALTIEYRNSEIVKPRYPKEDGLKLEEGQKLNFTHKEKPYNDFGKQILLPYKLSQNGPFLATGDINGDGLEDFFIGGAKGQSGEIFIQNTNQTFNRTNQIALVDDRSQEDMGAVFFDCDMDGDLDLFVVSGSNEFAKGQSELIDRLYLNMGNGQFSKSRNNFPKEWINGQAVSAFDLEGDGDLDLFVGGRLISGEYPKSPNSAIYENIDGTFKNVTNEVAPWLINFELVTDSEVCDVNKDGQKDLIIVGEWMRPVIALNQNGRLEKSPMQNVPEGIWWSVDVADFDEDGNDDFVLGNLGVNNKFAIKENSQLKIFAGDMDANGDFDMVIAKGKGRNFLPIRGRECTSQELPGTLQKFPTYAAYSKAEVADIIPANSTTFEKNATDLHSIYVKNLGDLKFSISNLPNDCQSGVIKDFEIGDYNEDGYTDFAFVGNHFPTEVETPRFDGLLHGICFGNGKGSFTAKHFLFEDQPAALDLRNIKRIRIQEKRFWVISQNNGPVLLFSG